MLSNMLSNMLSKACWRNVATTPACAGSRNVASGGARNVSDGPAACGVSGVGGVRAAL